MGMAGTTSAAIATVNAPNTGSTAPESKPGTNDRSLFLPCAERTRMRLPLPSRETG